MKNFNIKRILYICRALGILLIVIAVGIFVFWQVSSNYYAKRVHEYVSVLQKITPEPQNALLEDKSNNSMAVVSVEGNDFIGVLEFLANGYVFPVCDDWGNTREFPCRYKGSIYDGSMIIGAVNYKGQIDFVGNIFVGDKAAFTDLLGNCYAYEVKNIKYVKSINDKILDAEAGDIKLFIKNMYSLNEYTVIYFEA